MPIYNLKSLATASASSPARASKSSLAGVRPWRAAIALSVGALVFAALALLSLLSGRAIGVVTLLAALVLGYVALYNVQTARAVRLANRIIPSDERIVLSLGVIAPAWLWRGNNALLLIGDARQLVAIALPLAGAPTERWRIPVSELRRAEATERRLATLALTTTQGTVSLRMSGREAAESRAALERVRSAGAGAAPGPGEQ